MHIFRSMLKYTSIAFFFAYVAFAAAFEETSLREILVEENVVEFTKEEIPLVNDEKQNTKRYEPTWKSIDSRPLPSWFDEAKFGIFIHWGVFSVPSFGNEWFWWNWKGTKNAAIVNFMKRNYPPDFTYPDFAKEFTAELFQPNEWADLFKDSGAQYIVLTSKHHEGYTNWPSNVSWNWNSMDVGPHRDLVGDLASSIRNRTNLKFGVYHSLFEWFHPLYIQDKAGHFKSQSFVARKSMPELYELVNKYKPDIVWSDGDFAPDVYWNSTEFLAWLYNDSPVKDHVVTNDRWGTGIRCHHGGFYSCSDKYNPGVLQHHKWENCMTIDRHSWGYRRNANIQDYLTIHDIISTFASTISCGGNMLMNVGPTKAGMISPVFQDRLREFGSWLKVNGEAVYSSKPWSSQNDSVTPNIWYTEKSGAVYAFMLSWPKDNALVLGTPVVTEYSKVSMLGWTGPTITWRQSSVVSNKGIVVNLPVVPVSQLPCEWAWVIKLEYFD
uniref:alpha-L-fucosidase-like n=1 Tax=Ciona intestinalis TaxID=7719 RepID=UPI00089DD666|nr:alpha-L-fucosidase-like [Ciona intestinalis]|eukprot:XP_002124240.2 alpha-L-fucosidase-like [Ciona intestinalis]